MRRFADILKPGGVLLMTAPCGHDTLMAPLCRVYGPLRFPRLLAPFQIEKERYWVKDETNRWVPSSREQASQGKQHSGIAPAPLLAFGRGPEDLCG